jgi:3-oxoacyl-[acyl-carrier protein] reductase
LTTLRLEGRVAIVTGGAHGIGKEYCLGYADEGASVAVLDLDIESAEKVAADIQGSGNRAIAVAVDVASEERVAAAVRAVIDEFGRIDILVNNAAMFSVVPMSRVAFDQISVSEWDRLMEINVKGTWLMCREVAPHMREQGYGKVINIGSGSAFKGVTTNIHYVASKAAIEGLTRNLARELGPHGVTVNTIAPGSTLSEEQPSEETLLRRENSLHRRAIARVQLPSDLVGAAIFLGSRESDFITGQTLVVDGGDFMH